MNLREAPVRPAGQGRVIPLPRAMQEAIAADRRGRDLAAPPLPLAPVFPLPTAPVDVAEPDTDARTTWTDYRARPTDRRDPTLALQPAGRALTPWFPLAAPAGWRPHTSDGSTAAGSDLPPPPAARASPSAATALRQGGERPTPLVYGQAPAPRTGLHLEAELRIQGWAAPGTEIDLFGWPYRIGEGGRFLLSLAVDDPDLLARALAQHPPPALTLKRRR